MRKVVHDEVRTEGSHRNGLAGAVEQAHPRAQQAIEREPCWASDPAHRWVRDSGVSVGSPACFQP
jgi:hypothetical protein